MAVNLWSPSGDCHIGLTSGHTFIVPGDRAGAEVPHIFRRVALARGDLSFAASRKYSPVPGVLKRCEAYLPRPNDADRRPGRERWPYLIAEPKLHPHSAGTAKPTPEMNVA